nr:hypothetical protein [Planctomycetota bacterium]
MELSPVVCNNCGAPLQIPATANFLTCQHCQTQLEVKRNESVAWTEKHEQLETIDRRTGQLLDQMAQLRYQTELSHIDRAWDREEQRYMVRDQYGNTRRPSQMGSIVAGCVIAVFGFFFMFSGSGGVFLGLVAMCVGFAVSLAGNHQAIKHQNARRRYHRRRNDVRLEDYRLDLEEHPEEVNENPFPFLPRAPGTGPVEVRDE